MNNITRNFIIAIEKVEPGCAVPFFTNARSHTEDIEGLILRNIHKSGVVTEAFWWDESPEGPDYWEDIYDRLREYE